MGGGGFPAALTKKNLNYLYAGGRKAASPQPPPPHTPRLSTILLDRHVRGGGFPAAEQHKIFDYLTMNDSKFLNFDQPIDKHTGGNLPHWHQDGKIQFVTFRLADSLPTAVIEELKYRKETFLRNHPRPWDMTVQKEYWNQIGPMAEQLLDNGHGSCLLRHPAQPCPPAAAPPRQLRTAPHPAIYKRIYSSTDQPLDEPQRKTVDARILRQNRQIL